MEALGRDLQINIQYWELSGDPMSLIQVSHLGSSVPTPYSSTKTPQATQHRREKERKIEKNQTTYKQKQNG